MSIHLNIRKNFSKFYIPTCPVKTKKIQEETTHSKEKKILNCVHKYKNTHVFAAPMTTQTRQQKTPTIKKN